MASVPNKESGRIARPVRKFGGTARRRRRLGIERSVEYEVKEDSRQAITGFGLRTLPIMGIGTKNARRVRTRWNCRVERQDAGTRDRGSSPSRASQTAVIKKGLKAPKRVALLQL